MAKGLLAVFLSVCNTLPGYGGPSSPGKDTSASSSRRSQHAVGRSLHSLNGNSQSSIPSRKNAIPENGAAPTGYAAPESLLPGNSNRSLSNKNVAVAPKTPSPSKSSPPQRDSRQSSGGQAMPERPSTPSIRTIGSKTVGAPIPTAKPVVTPDTDEFVDFASFNDVPRNPVTVEVKPLPKIRLDLCPVPREEDEEGDESSISVGDGTKRTRKTSKHPKGSKNSKHRNKHRRSRK